jgi:hypothetical protein
MKAQVELISVLGEQRHAGHGRGEPLGIEADDFGGVLLDDVAKVLERDGRFDRSRARLDLELRGRDLYLEPLQGVGHWQCGVSLVTAG